MKKNRDTKVSTRLIDECLEKEKCESKTLPLDNSSGGGYMKILVLGASRGQIPIINLLHEYNCQVIAVSPKGDYAGIPLADEMAYLDVKDVENVLKVAKEKKVDGIVTEQLDEGVFTAASVAEQTGLRGIKSEVAKKFTNKFVMRQEAEKIGVCVPKNRCASDINQLIEKSRELLYPLMLKPTDSSASRGIYKVYCEEELLEKYPSTVSYSKSKTVIIEEFIRGKEYVVDAYTHDGEVTNLVVGKREYFNVKDKFIPRATLFVDADSADSQIEKRLKEVNSSLIKGFGLEFGITHAEYLYDQEKDKIYLVEIAARGGGVFISSHLIPMACGVNVSRLLVKDVLGIKFDENDLKIKKGASAYFCYLVPQGKVIKIEGTDKLLQIKNIEECFFDNIEVGMQTAEIRDKSSRKGPILVKGNSIEDCQKTLEIIKEKIDVQVLTDNGIQSIIWE